MPPDGHRSSGQAPFQGVVLCCTALTPDVRTKLAETAAQMGALTKLDLTADVTHLIVGSITTPKYRYVAKDRPDIAVLSPAWVEAVRVAWMEGDDDLDLEAIENEHRLPPFFGLQISITGFEEMEQRSNIERTVASNGGTYSGDMTRSTTHLLVADASVKSAKYIHARQWGINTVSLKWFEDSIIRGMALDESLYAPELPREQQGLGAFRQSPLRERTVLGKRGRPTTALESKSHEGSSRRKLRKATSLRLEGQSQDFWQEISAKDVQVDTSVVDAWGDETRASELASESARRTSTHNTLSINQLEKPPVFAHSEGLFSGHCILPFGFDESKLKAIKKYIEPNGAAIASSVEELIAASESDSSTCAYLLMPHDYPSTDLPRVPSSVCLITEWWIERSIQGKRALDPSEDVLSRPLPRLSDCSGTTICITGFTGVDYRQIAQALTIIGFSYQDKLLPSTSLLISGSTEMRKEKAYYAAKHQIPVVSADWLWSTMRAGRRKPMDKFLIKLSKPDPESSNKESPSSGNSARDESSAQKSNDQNPKRLSNSRRIRPTPSLVMNPASTTEPRRAGPFILEDELEEEERIEALPPTNDLTVPSKVLSPLAEISPNAPQRSPARQRYEQCHTAHAQDDEPPDKPKSIENHVASTTNHELNEYNEDLHAKVSDLVALVASRGVSRTTSAEAPPKRKHRPLGRNTSWVSNPSASTKSERNSPVRDLQKSQSGDASSNADGFNLSRNVQQIEPPSTQLGYDMDDMDDPHRRLMNEKLGCTLPTHAPAGKRVASVGTVTDNDFTMSKGPRVVRKSRQRKELPWP